MGGCGWSGWGGTDPAPFATTCISAFPRQPTRSGVRGKSPQPQRITSSSPMVRAARVAQRFRRPAASCWRRGPLPHHAQGTDAAHPWQPAISKQDHQRSPTYPSRPFPRVGVCMGTASTAGVASESQVPSTHRRAPRGRFAPKRHGQCPQTPHQNPSAHTNAAAFSHALPSRVQMREVRQSASLNAVPLRRGQPKPNYSSPSRPSACLQRREHSRSKP